MTDIPDHEVTDAVEQLAASVADLRGELERQEATLQSAAAQLSAGFLSIAKLAEEGAEDAERVADLVVTAVHERVSAAGFANDEWVALQATIEDEVKQSADGVQQVDETLVELKERAETFTEQLDDLASNALATQDEMIDLLEISADTAVETLDEASDQLDEFVQDFEEALDGLSGAIEALMETTAEDLEERMHTAMRAATDAVAEAMKEAANMLADNALPAIARETAVELVAQLTGVVDELLAGFRSTIAGLRQQIFDGSAETGQSRQVVDGALEELRFLLDPIQAEIGRIRGLASSVGIGV